MKKLILFLGICVYSTAMFSQNITNTLGTSGLFIIKDGADSFLTLDQSTGQMNILKTLRLENTTGPDLGVIFKGTDRFIHNFGTSNTFMGINSGNFNMTGAYNVSIGALSLLSNETGERNTAVGTGSLYSNTTGNYNIAIGNGSLSSNTSGTGNTALGNQSLGANTSGGQNTALGYQSLYSSTTARFNTASGYYSLYANTTGEDNTASGNYSLYANTTGIANTALGSFAGTSITTGINLTCLGFGAQPTSADATNQIALGNGDITSLRCNVQTITSLSDARDKKNITELKLGIDFLMKIKPRLFNWDKREWYDGNKSDGSKMKEEPTAGFIAQEFDEVQTSENAEWLNLVLKDNPEKWEATPGNLLPIIVKAIQDLKTEKDTEIAELKSENEELKNDNEKLSAEVESLKSMNEKMVKLEQMINDLASSKYISFSVIK